jgi:hypothetical protein
VHAASIFFGDLGMASTADLRDRGTKLGGLSAWDFVRHTVASGTVRSSAVALACSLAVHAAGIVFDHATVACCAHRLGNSGMGIIFMLKVATLAGNGRVHVPLKLIAHFTVTR